MPGDTFAGAPDGVDETAGQHERVAAVSDHPRRGIAGNRSRRRPSPIFMSKHALILGGGFAGLEAAIQLRRRGLRVTLVSNRPFLFLYPTSIWVATGETPFDNVCLDLPDLARRHGFAFRRG